MKEYIAFAIMCFIVVWSAIRGYQRWKQGKIFRSLVYTTTGAFALTKVIATLGEWL